MTANGVHVNGSTNGHSRPLRGLKPGVYAPIPTFFLPDSEELDIPAFESHVLRVAKAGVGPLLAGSMGEAHHLSDAERSVLIRAARRALDSAGLEGVPIISGIGSGSTRSVVQLGKEAADAGADATIAILSGYFAGALASNRKALKAFWTEVSEKSPVPVLIYNYPGAAGGIDLDSELVTDLARECPNLAGVKLTCGNVGKLTRICATISDKSFTAAHPRRNPAFPFLVLGGYADFLLPSAFANGHGAITGLANIAPHTLTRLFELCTAALSDPSVLPEAQRLQGIVARADSTISKTGIAGTKYILEKLYGYGGPPRRPLVPIELELGEALYAHPDTVAIVAVERELAGKL
ncbi:dihydrodipicolinate synthetase [Fomitiporia mediterranea MF3/22]|uniref:dihydrodipicolinate synthetase n=1 Tax=Fomitiporia mediterranea (strain MF3/22) TaxID=694068 RepID=UPI000440893A|nr:dihydrodipicolinate synthetase [Fomitiporia mediterranea MF3/22]EJD02436.1 dihydrodipicolinate synthetase [Fomitiporia mediterranea MF3/22]